MKKTLLITTAVLTLNSAYADTSFKSGAVVGIGMGYNQLSGKAHDNLFFAPGLASNTETRKTQKSNGFVADLFAGWRFKLTERFLLGFDVSLSKDTNILKHKLGINRSSYLNITELERIYSVTPSLIAGYSFNQWMVYGKFGISISRFNLDNKLIATTATTTSEKNYTRLGLKETVGVEYAMNEKASVFSEISFEQIRSIKADLKNPAGVPPLAGATHDIKIKPRYFTAKLGLMYKL